MCLSVLHQLFVSPVGVQPVTPAAVNAKCELTGTTGNLTASLGCSIGVVGKLSDIITRIMGNFGE
jgi:hypothetical protein